MQSVRETSRRNTCANNLKQIALAAQSYHNSFKTFPLGNVTLTQGICHGAALPGVGYPSQDGPNWLILLLPFVDQQPVYDNYDFHAFNESAANVARPANLSRRPTSVRRIRTPIRLRFRPAGRAAALSLPYMPGSYRAMCGRSDGRDFLDNGSIRLPPIRSRGAARSIRRASSNFGAEQIASIIDGTSNTLMAGESTTMGGPNPRTSTTGRSGHIRSPRTACRRRRPRPAPCMPDYETCAAASGNGSQRTLPA